MKKFSFLLTMLTTVSSVFATNNELREAYKSYGESRKQFETSVQECDLLMEEIERAFQQQTTLENEKPEFLKANINKNGAEGQALNFINKIKNENNSIKIEINEDFINTCNVFFNEKSNPFINAYANFITSHMISPFFNAADDGKNVSQFITFLMQYHYQPNEIKDCNKIMEDLSLKKFNDSEKSNAMIVIMALYRNDKINHTHQLNDIISLFSPYMSPAGLCKIIATASKLGPKNLVEIVEIITKNKTNLFPSTDQVDKKKSTLICEYLSSPVDKITELLETKRDHSLSSEKYQERDFAYQALNIDQKQAISTFIEEVDTRYRPRLTKAFQPLKSEQIEKVIELLPSWAHPYDWEKIIDACSNLTLQQIEKVVALSDSHPQKHRAYSSIQSLEITAAYDNSTRAHDDRLNKALSESNEYASYILECTHAASLFSDDMNIDVCKGIVELCKNLTIDHIATISSVLSSNMNTPTRMLSIKKCAESTAEKVEKIAPLLSENMTGQQRFLVLDTCLPLTIEQIKQISASMNEEQLNEGYFKKIQLSIKNILSKK